MIMDVKGYIYEGKTFVMDKEVIKNAKDEQFVEGSAFLQVEKIKDGKIEVNVIKKGE